jgi:hypothetical protein
VLSILGEAIDEIANWKKQGVALPECGFASLGKSRNLEKREPAPTELASLDRMICTKKEGSAACPAECRIIRSTEASCQV